MTSWVRILFDEKISTSGKLNAHAYGLWRKSVFINEQFGSEKMVSVNEQIGNDCPFNDIVCP